MSHFLTVPLNENGVIVDDKIDSILFQVMNPPFNFSDVFIYSHGWWTTAVRAMDEYNRFSVEFARMVMTLVNTLLSPPSSSLGIGIHWPSMLSEDDRTIVNFGEALSFYTMEKRADTVGEHGVYTILRLLLQARASNQSPLRLHFIGHCFGCKVVCAALQEILNDQATVKIPANFTIDVVLLQAAFDNDDLEGGNIYGGLVSGFPTLRLVVTRSDQDRALKDWYPKAHVVSFFRHPTSPRMALGASGPTDKVVQQFAGADRTDVGPGFASASVAALGSRLVVADLTPLHQVSAATIDPFSGRHSDIFHEEIYQLLAGFLFH